MNDIDHVQWRTWRMFVIHTMAYILVFDVIVVTLSMSVDAIFFLLPIHERWIAAKTFIVGIPSFVFVYAVVRKKFQYCGQITKEEKNMSLLSSVGKYRLIASCILFVAGGIFCWYILYEYILTERQARMLLIMWPSAGFIFGFAFFCSDIIARK